MIGTVCVVLVGLAAAQSQGSSEEVARRQLESGRAFARQGNHVEALRDFLAVAETHAATTVADDAWLELARHYLEVAGDPVRSQTAVDAILTNYATSDSAPAAYVLAGRLALARGRLLEHLGEFERSEASLREALRAGSQWHQYDLMQEAASSLIALIGHHQGRPEDGLQYLALARGLATGDPRRARVGGDCC